jgi:hypothetical protein
VLEGLAALVDASLLQPSDAAAESVDGGDSAGDGAASDAVWDGPRFRMLETVGEYALERLDASPDVGAVRRCHAAYFTALAERGEPELRGPRATAWLSRFERDLDNIRAALAWCVREEEASLGLRLFGKLSAHWYLRGDPAEARRWLDGLLALPDAGTAEGLVRALNAGAIVALRQGDLGALQRYAADALAAARARADAAGAAFARVALLLAGVGEAGRPATPADVAAALAEAEAPGDVWLRAFGSVCAGFALARAGQAERAAALLAVALEGFRATGDLWGIAESAVELGQVALARDDPAGAARLFATGFAAHRALGHRQGAARCLAGAAAAAGRTDPRGAARLLGVADALLDAAGAPLGGIYAEEIARHSAAVRARLGADAFAAALLEGRRRSPDAAAFDIERIAHGAASQTDSP